jgi:hypothetical protein
LRRCRNHTGNASNISFIAIIAKASYSPILPRMWSRLNAASTRLAVTVRVVDLVGVVLSTEVVILLGADTLGEHGAGQDSRGVLGEVVLLVVCVEVGVDLSKLATDLKLCHNFDLQRHIPRYHHRPSSTHRQCWRECRSCRIRLGWRNRQSDPSSIR